MHGHRVQQTPSRCLVQPARRIVPHAWVMQHIAICIGKMLVAYVEDGVATTPRVCIHVPNDTT
jgi:hypothetical protein